MNLAAVRNLYVHFPFCRRKCTYCVLPSRAGVPPAGRMDYVNRLARALEGLPRGGEGMPEPFATIYFGGGSPGLCDLRPLEKALERLSDKGTEFTVELHPLDATREKLEELKSIGVNRISLGVQSLDDGILAHMGRGYTFDEAERAFLLVKEHFDNSGIDLVVGYPGETSALTPRHARLAKWGLRHCSAYSLILEKGSLLQRLLDRNAVSLPDDSTVLNRIAVVARMLRDLGLERYEISNYAVPGYECRHNLATWRGEDYIGLGDGACGRIGLHRTRNYWGLETMSGRGIGPNQTEYVQSIEKTSAENDATERRIFALRTSAGLDVSGRPAWEPILDHFTAKGLLTKSGNAYRLTERGTEVCDSILAELVD